MDSPSDDAPNPVPMFWPGCWPAPADIPQLIPGVAETDDLTDAGMMLAQAGIDADFIAFAQQLSNARSCGLSVTASALAQAVIACHAAMPPAPDDLGPAW